MGGEETKLREELAAMTKKATDLEVVIMMMMGMMIRWPTISCFLTIMMMSNMMMVSRCEFEDLRGSVRRRAIGIRLWNGREERLPGIITNIIIVIININIIINKN